VRTYYYDNYILSLSGEFQQRLERIESVYNFDLGDEFEIAICEVLRDLLPLKYGICRGFVVDYLGNKEGDDIIIYDQDRFPSLRMCKREDFARKNKIPIEAVYAYIEAKHTLVFGDPKNSSDLNHAIEQLSRVKALCLSRPKLPLWQNDPYYLETYKRPNPAPLLPSYRNPVFTAVFSRFAGERTASDRITDPEKIRKVMTEYDIPSNPNIPELIVCGRDNYMQVAEFDESVQKHKPTMFQLPQGKTGYEVNVGIGTAYGSFCASLFHALDWIRLGRMPWEDILNNARFENYKFGTY
jgi:hypothetical protein